MNSASSSYVVAGRETVAEVPGLRVRRLTLDAGQCVPWHYHSEITDTFFCMQGPMSIETRRPTAMHRLMPGDSIAVTPGTPHYVRGENNGPCQFMIVQGVGVYDYVSASESEA